MINEKYLPVFAGLSFSSIFGFSFLFTKNTLDYLSPFRLLAFRFLIAAAALIIMWLTGIIQPEFRDKKLKLLFLLSLAQPIFYFIFETLGINRTTSSEAGLMISLIPVAVTVLAAIILKENPNRKQLIFISLSVTGVIFIIIMKGSLDVQSNYLGMLLLGGAVLMAALYNILSRMLSINFKPVEITFFMMCSGAIIFNLMAFYQHQGGIITYFQPLFELQVLIAVLYLGLLSSVVAFFMMNYTLSRIQAFQAAVFANLVTVISIIAGVFFRGESFYWFQVVGAIMIIIGVWGTNYYGELEKPPAEFTS